MMNIEDKERYKRHTMLLLVTKCATYLYGFEEKEHTQ